MRRPSGTRRVAGFRSRLTLRARLTLISAVAVAVAIALASTAAWFATRATLREQLDQSMLGGVVTRAREAGPPAGGRLAVVAPQADLRRLCDQSGRIPDIQRFLVGIQLIRADGTSCAPGSVDVVAPTASDVAVARGEQDRALHDATSEQGTHVRVLTRPVADGYAVLTSRSLVEVDSSLDQLALVLLLVTALGVVGAASAGLVVARAGLAPVDHLTKAAEHISRTEDLDVPIEVRGNDEVARLARAFNAMTSALANSRERQQQLVADAGHELRTPLTSLRTNIEWLMRSEDSERPLTKARRRQLLASVTSQVDELGHLIGELSVLAADERARPKTAVPLDEVVLRAAERAQLRAGTRRIDLHLQPVSLTGDAEALERAVLNVLDNAVKFSPEGSTITVRLGDGRLDVSDEGPGVPAEERTLVFERFWRSPSARELPGSGLGLAIVADAVADHGGRVHLEPSPSGGTTVAIRLAPA